MANPICWNRGALRAAVADAGSRFLDPGTMRFMKSRLLGIMPGGDFTYFVTSEQPWGMNGRRYLVRRWDGETVDTLDYEGKTGKPASDCLHPTSRSARRAMLRFAKEGK